VTYQNIAKACRLIAIDNGGIHRDRSVEKQARQYRSWIARREDPTLAEIDGWLGGLSDTDLATACCGETSEAEAVLVTAPAFTDDLLNAYFEEVC